MYSIENIVIPHDISDQANGSNLHSLLAITRFVFNFFFLFLHHLNYIQQTPYASEHILDFLFWNGENGRHELYLLLFHAPAYIFHIKPEDTVYFFHSRILFLLASPELSKCFSYLIDIFIRYHRSFCKSKDVQIFSFWLFIKIPEPPVFFIPVHFLECWCSISSKVR